LFGKHRGDWGCSLFITISFARPGSIDVYAMLMSPQIVFRFVDHLVPVLLLLSTITLGIVTVIGHFQIGLYIWIDTSKRPVRFE